MIRKQGGFSIVIIMVILLAIGVAGFVGWKVYDKSTQKKVVVVSPQTTQTQAAQTAPKQNTDTVSTAQLKEYCSEVEKACFKYPADWTLKVNSKYSNDPDNLATESVTVTSPNSTAIGWRAPVEGLGGGCDYTPENEVYIDSLKANAQDKQLRIVKTHVGTDPNNKVRIGYYKPEASTQPATAGKTGDCIFYFTYRKGAVGQTPVVMFYTNGYNQKDEAATYQIFESLTYK